MQVLMRDCYFSLAYFDHVKGTLVAPCLLNVDIVKRSVKKKKINEIATSSLIFLLSFAMMTS